MGGQVEALPSVYAAGSLREALTAIAAEYARHGACRPGLTFGAAGLLRERIEQGEPAQIYVSADLAGPQRLAACGGWQPPQVLARNSLCALVAPHLDVRSDTLLATLLHPGVRVGTSTPQADPSGDYAWALFRQAEAVQAGAYAVLDAKALRLTGAASTPRPPSGRGTYAWIMAQGWADVFLTYRTNAVAAQREVPGLKIVSLPPALQVEVVYGLTVHQHASAAAHDFVRHLLSGGVQARLRELGFGPA